MRMPVLDGYAATQEIRTLPGGEGVKIVAITASVLEEEQVKSWPRAVMLWCASLSRSMEIFEAMARLLGVEYVYGQAANAGTGANCRTHTRDAGRIAPGPLQNCGKRRWR